MTAPFRPVFVVGAPRSGTTLLRVMLNRHAAIGLCDETYFFYYVNARRNTFGDLADPDRRRLLIDRYLETDRMRRLQLDLPALRERLQAGGLTYESFFAVILAFYAESQGKQRPGEKTPHHAWHTGDLLSWYPEGRVIHLMRDPRDVCGSLFNVSWGRRSALANGRLWTSLTEAAERHHDNPRFLSVRYEELIERPEATLRSVCEFLEEPFDAAMLVAEPDAQTDKPWFQRAQGALSRDRTGRWRDQLTPEQVQLVEWAAGDLMARYGYEAAQPPAPAPVRRRGMMQERMESLVDRLKRAPRLWYYWMRPRDLAAEERWIDR